MLPGVEIRFPDPFLSRCRDNPPRGTVSWQVSDPVRPRNLSKRVPILLQALRRKGAARHSSRLSAPLLVKTGRLWFAAPVQTQRGIGKSSQVISRRTEVAHPLGPRQVY